MNIPSTRQARAIRRRSLRISFKRRRRLPRFFCVKDFSFNKNWNCHLILDYNFFRCTALKMSTMASTRTKACKSVRLPSKDVTIFSSSWKTFTCRENLCSSLKFKLFPHSTLLSSKKAYKHSSKGEKGEKGDRGAPVSFGRKFSLTSVKCNWHFPKIQLYPIIDSQGSPGNSIRGAPGPPGIGIKGECQVVNTITKEEVRDTHNFKSSLGWKIENFFYGNLRVGENLWNLCGRRNSLS